MNEMNTEWIVWVDGVLKDDGTPKDVIILFARDPEHAAEVFASYRYIPSEAPKHFTVAVLQTCDSLPTAEDVALADVFDVHVTQNQEFKAFWIGE